MWAALPAVADTIRCCWHGFLRRIVGHAAILGVGRSLDREAKRWDVCRTTVGWGSVEGQILARRIYHVGITVLCYC
jgi:hypothetical protein